MDTISPVSDQQKGISKKNRIVKKSSKKMNLRSPRVGSKMKKQKFSRKPKPALYIGHIPHGFYEDEMNAYFSQFGKVHSVTVMRSKKTGRSKGYGFVEFEDEEVAKIASETMNNYLMFSKVLKCKYIPPEEGKRKFSASAVCPVLPRVKNRRLDSENKKKAFATLDQESYQKKTHKKINHFKKFLEEKGIDFPFKV